MCGNYKYVYLSANVFFLGGDKNSWRGTSTTSPIRHGGASVMACACMATSGNDTLAFTEDVTADGRDRVNALLDRSSLLFRFSQRHQNSVSHISSHSRTVI